MQSHGGHVIIASDDDGDDDERRCMIAQIDQPKVIDARFRFGKKNQSAAPHEASSDEEKKKKKKKLNPKKRVFEKISSHPIGPGGREE